ncbi:MAG: hypothetical protein ISS77_02485 [Phycisphaerae bacterium]|nr:hypothetical protein [Phycisphaerae bacterium]
MAETKKTDEKKVNVKKSFLTVGPTLHYSHQNVIRCWLLALLTYGLVAFFWTKIINGQFWSPNIEVLKNLSLWKLGDLTISGVSIFEYPWHILVLGLLMGILAIIPVIAALLMSFSHSLPFILIAAFVANLPGLAASLLIGCFAVACRPLRFRSRFIALALCTAPMLIYWLVFGSIEKLDPLRWGFAFSPWITAWLVGLGIAAIIIIIGHFNRYRPGLIWITTFIFLIITTFIFEVTIGFDELDYQLYVAKNNPEQIAEFHDHSISPALQKTISDENIKSYLREAYFFPLEPNELRVALKKSIQEKLTNDRWPSWLAITDELKYQQKKQYLLQQYDHFIKLRPSSKRMPIALYYKALLSDFSPDIKLIEKQEVLHFYSDYPHEMNLESWHRLYKEYPQTPESIPARLRYARHLAGQGRLEKARQMLHEALQMAAERLGGLKEKKEITQQDNEKNSTIFKSPAESVISEFDLLELKRELNELITLISQQNYTQDEQSQRRLAVFVMLNPHSKNYCHQLDDLSEKLEDNDPLADNVMLANAMMIERDAEKVNQLSKIHEKFSGSDAAVQALYELSRLRIELWQKCQKNDTEKKNQLLAVAKNKLKEFINLYPESFYTQEARKKLNDLPGSD